MVRLDEAFSTTLENVTKSASVEGARAVATKAGVGAATSLDAENFRKFSKSKHTPTFLMLGNVMIASPPRIHGLAHRCEASKSEGSRTDKTFERVIPPPSGDTSRVTSAHAPRGGGSCNWDCVLNRETWRYRLPDPLGVHARMSCEG